MPRSLALSFIGSEYIDINLLFPFNLPCPIHSSHYLYEQSSSPPDLVLLGSSCSRHGKQKKHTVVNKKANSSSLERSWQSPKDILFSNPQMTAWLIFFNVLVAFHVLVYESRHIISDSVQSQFVSELSFIVPHRFFLLFMAIINRPSDMTGLISIYIQFGVCLVLDARTGPRAANHVQRASLVLW
jgi:hypothetical protein